MKNHYPLVSGFLIIVFCVLLLFGKQLPQIYQWIVFWLFAFVGFIITLTLFIQPANKKRKNEFLRKTGVQTTGYFIEIQQTDNNKLQVKYQYQVGERLWTFTLDINLTSATRRLTDRLFDVYYDPHKPSEHFADLPIWLTGSEPSLNKIAVPFFFVLALLFLKPGKIYPPPVTEDSERLVYIEDFRHTVTVYDPDRQASYHLKSGDGEYSSPSWAWDNNSIHFANKHDSRTRNELPGQRFHYKYNLREKFLDMETYICQALFDETNYGVNYVDYSIRDASFLFVSIPYMLFYDAARDTCSIVCKRYSIQDINLGFDHRYVAIVTTAGSGRSFGEQQIEIIRLADTTVILTLRDVDDDFLSHYAGEISEDCFYYVVAEPSDSIIGIPAGVRRLKSSTLIKYDLRTGEKTELYRHIGKMELRSPTFRRTDKFYFTGHYRRKSDIWRLQLGDSARLEQLTFDEKYKTQLEISN